MGTATSYSQPVKDHNRQLPADDRQLPRADDCFAKTSKCLDLHDVDTQTNRLSPPKDQNNQDDCRDPDSDSTESDHADLEQTVEQSIIESKLTTEKFELQTTV